MKVLWWIGFYAAVMVVVPPLAVPLGLADFFLQAKRNMK